MTFTTGAVRDRADLIAGILDAFPVSAAPFLVTLYGDVVAPRGGEAWTGNIVEICAEVGIAESRVRTALSRLVAAGRLEGSRVGRRSFHRLTPSAAREFAAAARLIYAPVEPPALRGWHLVLRPGGDAAPLTRLRFGLATPELALLPDRGAPLPDLDGIRFVAATRSDLSDIVAGAWPLADLAARMRRFAAGFGPLRAVELPPAEALGLRLMLVHAFREIALRDPLLPPELLPADWPGPTARALFVRLYAALSPGADAAAARLVDRAGPVGADSDRLGRRLADMTAEG